MIRSKETCQHQDGHGCDKEAVGLVEGAQGAVVLCAEHLMNAVRRGMYEGLTANIQFWGFDPKANEEPF